MGGFAFRLEHQDGTPAEPRTFEAAVPNWGPGDTIHLARERALSGLLAVFLLGWVVSEVRKWHAARRGGRILT
jgi:hypothetical protein